MVKKMNEVAQQKTSDVKDTEQEQDPVTGNRTDVHQQELKPQQMLTGASPDAHQTGSQQDLPPAHSSRAVAHQPEHSRAVAHQQELTDDSSQASLVKSKFSYANVAARQKAAEAATIATEAADAPPPPAPATGRKRTAPRLTLQTHHVLPDDTPPFHWHPLINSHPWARYVTLRDSPLPTNPEFVTSAVPLLFYRHLTDGGYLSNRLVRSLFPRTFREKPSRQHRLPIFELMRLEHAVEFRRSSQEVIDQLCGRTYVTSENNLLQTPANVMPSVTLPERRPNFPVLYQVVSRSHGQGVILEAKDFFIPGPDRRELHLIVLDQYATNIKSGSRGFDRSILSVKDFVWVYSVEPTRVAHRNPQQTLHEARIPRATALDNRFPYFFRVKEFVFVTPPSSNRKTFGIILSAIRRKSLVTTLRIAFKGAPEAVTVSPSVCDFSLEDVEADEIVSAISRPNVSCAIRFSEPPVSKEAQSALVTLVRDFLPAHPDEGLLPLKVSKLSPSDKDWIRDRAGDFKSYSSDPIRAQRKMARLFNVACSALAAINSINDDRRTHMIQASVPSMTAFPLRLDFTINDMSSECGWTNQRPVYLWIVQSQSLIRATIERSAHSYDQRRIAVRLVVPVWSHRSATRAVRDFGGFANGNIFVDIRVKLGPPSTGADPVYEIISSLQLFNDITNTRGTRAGEVLDSIYGRSPASIRPVGPQQELSVTSIAGNSIELRPDQVHALEMGDLDLPILAIQAAYGTGKTVVGALIAARIHSAKQAMVLATTTTNNAVAQFTDTLLKLDQYKHLDVLRYVSDSALQEGAPQTPVDLHTILKRLADDYEHLLTNETHDICLRYKRGRELLEEYMFDPERAMNLSEFEREQYRLAERDISDITKDAIEVMFKVRPPAVVCMTTAALLNAVSPGGIFQHYLSDVQTIIGDEASQIPEPAMVAIATRLANARHIYIGDTHQLQPHVRCQRDLNPVRFGAQGVMDLLLAKGVPSAPLTTTFRAHPSLNELANIAFYERTLVSGASAQHRQMLLANVRCPNPDVPFVFVDVAGHSQRALSGSHFNVSEAEVCRQVVMSLLSKGISPDSIAIIVFYKEQYRALEHFSATHSVDIYTVDSVQGREKDIVLLLSTRTDFDSSQGDFLDDPRRLNVALSRCRHGQFVLGNVSSLAKLSHWKTIIDWAETRRTLTTSETLPDLLEQEVEPPTLDY